MNYAIVLAAGKGTRMKTDLPKCLYPLLYKPMITYIIETLKKTSIDKIVTVLGYKSEFFAGVLDDDVLIAIQKEQLGTAHAVLSSKELVEGDGCSIILPGDTPLIDIEMIEDLLNAHQKTNNGMTVGVVKLDNPHGYGRVVVKNGAVQQIVEELDATDEERKIKLVNTGLMVVDNKLLFTALEKIDNNNAKKEYYLTDLVEKLQSNGVGYYQLDDAKLQGINDMNTLISVEESLRQSIIQKHLRNGVRIVNPQTVTISTDVEIEPQATIYPGSILYGESKIKSGAIIGPNSEIYNSTIEENAVIRHSVVFDSYVKQSANVGPFAHLRMHTVVGERDRVGNFVEIKNSTLGTKTNASHLSYIGDSELGNNVNFGCGAITVNYDGAKKHKTIIHDLAFIGCNSNLIAPVEIGENTIVAAGTTVTKDVPADDLAISRLRQENKSGYAKKYKQLKEE